MTGRMAQDRLLKWTGMGLRITTVIVILQLLRPGVGDAQDALSRAQASIARRDYKTALPLLQEAVQQMPTSAEAHHLLGVALKGVRRSDEALSEFQEALRLKPKYAEARFEAGLIQLEKGQRAEAEAAFKKGIEQQLKPLGPLYYGMGLVKMAEDSLNAANKWLIRATTEDPRNGTYHKALGDIYAKQLITELAVNEYNQALELNPNDPDVHYSIGKMHFKDRKWPEVLKAWQDAVAADSNFVPVYKDLINLYMIMKPPRYEEAVPLLKRAVEFHPEDTKLPVELAKAMAKTQTYRAEALPYLEKAATLVSDDAEVHALIGDISSENKDHARAVEAYQKATQIDPEFVGALKGLAEAQKSSGDTTAAIETMKTIAEKDTSGNGGVEGALGYLLYQQGRYDEAIPNLKEKLQSSPKLAILYRLLGLCYIKKSDYGAILSDVKPALDSAVATFPDDKAKLSMVYSELGGELFRAKRYGEAIEMFQKRLEQDPENWSVHLNVGYAYFQQKAYSKAIEEFRKVTQLKPDNANAYLMLGVCYGETKNSSQAKSAFLKVVDLDPKNVDALKQVGLAYLLEAQALQKAEKHKESQGVAGQAVGYLQRAVAQKPNDIQARVLLAQGLVLSKQLEKAKEEFRRILRMDPNNTDAQQGLERLGEE
ncbi:tetratricopeptide repeat protein [bacterium]|nr:tetratricopeptide repeat protein [bacterium]